MDIKPAIGLVVGPVNDTHWGQVLTSPSSYAIVEIEDTSKGAQQIGVSVLSKLGEFLNNEPNSLREIEDIADRVMQQAVRTLVILIPIGTVVYLVVRGKGSVYIKRGNELASLMHQDGAISGEVKKGDTILMASDGFSSVLTREELTNLFDHLPPKDIAEKLTLILHEKTGGEGSVACVFGVSEIVEHEPVIETSPDGRINIETEDVNAEPPVRSPSSVSLTRIRLPVFGARIVSFLKDSPKKWKIAIAAVVTGFFIVTVILGINKQSKTRRNEQLTEKISQAQHALDEGAALLELNPVKGRERLGEAKAILEPLTQSVSERTAEGLQVRDLYQKVQDNITRALNVVDDPVSLFYDMGLLKKGAAVSSVARDGARLVISDAATNTVYGMDISTKNAQVLGGGSKLKSLSLAGVHGDITYVLTAEGIAKIVKGSETPQIVVKKDDAWGRIDGLVAYGGNLYLMDSHKSRIWKYVSQEKGFSQTREYLNPDVFTDFTRSTGMAIDGSVWVGTATGKILKFTQGREDVFSPAGVEPALGTLLLVYTSDDTNHIYVLEKDQNRVVVLDKDGTYIAQYRYSGITATNMLVFEQQKLLLLTTADKLYSLQLK